jgi:hypothetical protein
MIRLEMMDGCSNQLWMMQGRSARSLVNDLTDEAIRVPNLYDEYIGYPHWFWAFPSHHLAEPTAEYDRNLKTGFEFVLS